MKKTKILDIPVIEDNNSLYIGKSIIDLSSKRIDELLAKIKSGVDDINSKINNIDVTINDTDISGITKNISKNIEKNPLNFKLNENYYSNTLYELFLENPNKPYLNNNGKMVYPIFYFELYKLNHNNEYELVDKSTYEYFYRYNSIKIKFPSYGSYKIRANYVNEDKYYYTPISIKIKDYFTMIVMGNVINFKASDDAEIFWDEEITPEDLESSSSSSSSSSSGSGSGDSDVDSEVDIYSGEYYNWLCKPPTTYEYEKMNHTIVHEYNAEIDFRIEVGDSGSGDSYATYSEENRIGDRYDFFADETLGVGSGRGSYKTDYSDFEELSDIMNKYQPNLKLYEHTYDDGKKYHKIKIKFKSGNKHIFGIRGESLTNKHKVIGSKGVIFKILNFGETPFTSLEHMFEGSNDFLLGPNINTIQTESNCKADRMFYLNKKNYEHYRSDPYNFSKIKINFKNIVSMDWMFVGVKHDVYNSTLLYADTSNVRSMKGTFYNSGVNFALNWDTSNVTDMSYMFALAEIINIKDLTNSWDTSNVIDMSYMFFKIPDNGTQLVDFDTSNVTDMSYMFYNCGDHITFTLDTSNVTNMDHMFAFSHGDITVNFDTPKVTNMSYLFYGCYNFNQPLNWDTSSVKVMNSMFGYCHTFNQPLNWDTSKVKDMSSMFYRCYTFNQPLNWDTSSVKDMSYLFYRCDKFNQPLNWNTSSAISTNSMFYYCSEFNQPINFSDTSKVKTMNSMFYGCNYFNQPLDFDTSEVLDISNMFHDCYAFQFRIHFDLKNVVSAYNFISTYVTSPSLSNMELYNCRFSFKEINESRYYHNYGTKYIVIRNPNKSIMSFNSDKFSPIIEIKYFKDGNLFHNFGIKNENLEIDADSYVYVTFLFNRFISFKTNQDTLYINYISDFEDNKLHGLENMFKDIKNVYIEREDQRKLILSSLYYNNDINGEFSGVENVNFDIVFHGSARGSFIDSKIDTKWLKFDEWEFEKLYKTFQNYYPSNGFEVDFSQYDLSNLYQMIYTFKGSSFNGIIDNDFQNLESAFGAFMDCENLNKPIKMRNTHNLNTLSEFLANNIWFNQSVEIDDFSSVWHMDKMFYNDQSLNQDFEDWNVTESCTKIDTFYNCNKQVIPSWYNA